MKVKVENNRDLVSCVDAIFQHMTDKWNWKPDVILSITGAEFTDKAKNDISSVKANLFKNGIVKAITPNNCFIITDGLYRTSKFSKDVTKLVDDALAVEKIKFVEQKLKVFGITNWKNEFCVSYEYIFKKNSYHDAIYEFNNVMVLI